MLPWKLYIDAILLTACTLLVSSQPTKEQLKHKTKSVRLPGTIRPTRYDVTMNINPYADGYIGTVNMTFDVISDSPIKELYFHAEYEYVLVQSLLINNMVSPRINLPDADNVIYETFSVPLSGTNNFAYMQYIGNFSSEQYGLVKTKGPSELKKQYKLQSQFEPTYTRRAFPCIDEQDLPAVFSLQVLHPADYTAVSNTEISSEDTTTSRQVAMSREEDGTNSLARNLQDTQSMIGFGFDYGNLSYHLKYLKLPCHSGSALITAHGDGA